MSAAGHAPDVAGAANISAFTLGSAIGIYIGGAAIDAGLGLTSVNWIGGLMTAAGLLVAVASIRTRAEQSPVQEPVTTGHAGGHVH